jgi:transcriptional regulator with GAF, ATPase, and Fis domain
VKLFFQLLKDSSPETIITCNSSQETKKSDQNSSRKEPEMVSSITETGERQRTANTGHTLVGDSQPIKEVEQDIALSAGADITVLITGESGAGKELVAQAIHRSSDRVGGPFKAINCGSVTESLLEARLFGHVRGSFTGATGNQSGLFEAANGGTIFLDEIGDMPIALQAHLLRVLQERTIVPVGSNTDRRVDVRVIAATNKDLQREVKEGRFRQDLYYRLNEFPIRVPALREHPSDIPLLVHHFLESVEIEEGALALLCSYPWPGNVRELKATVNRLRLRTGGNGIITTGHVWREIGTIERFMSESLANDGDYEVGRDVIRFTVELRRGESLDDLFSRQKLRTYNALVKWTGSRRKAAEWLRLPPQAFHQRIRRLQEQVRSLPLPASGSSERPGEGGNFRSQE